MLSQLAAFVPVAALLTLAPGPGTAMVVRSAVRGGRRRALLTTIGNSLGVLAWGLFAAIGIAAVVATSAEAFTVVKLVGAVALIVLGVQSLRRGRQAVDPPRRASSGRGPAREPTPGDAPRRASFERAREDGPRCASPAPGLAREPTQGALRDGLVTSVANPKLAVFYVALFPQFVPPGAPVLPSALSMAALVVAFDLVWYSALAYAVARARRAFVEGPWLRRAERLTGAVLVGLGVRLAVERR